MKLPKEHSEKKKRKRKKQRKHFDIGSVPGAREGIALLIFHQIFYLELEAFMVQSLIDKHFSLICPKRVEKSPMQFSNDKSSRNGEPMRGLVMPSSSIVAYVM